MSSAARLFPLSGCSFLISSSSDTFVGVAVGGSTSRSPKDGTSESPLSLLFDFDRMATAWTRCGFPVGRWTVNEMNRA